MNETVTIEKQVWESTLHRSMVLQAENEQLKEQLKIAREAIEAKKAWAWAVQTLKQIDEVLK